MSLVSSWVLLPRLMDPYTIREAKEVILYIFMWNVSSSCSCGSRARTWPWYMCGHINRISCFVYLGTFRRYRPLGSSSPALVLTGVSEPLCFPQTALDPLVGFSRCFREQMIMTVGSDELQTDGFGEQSWGRINHLHCCRFGPVCFNASQT